MKKKPPAPTTVPLPDRLEQEPAKWYARFCKWLLQPAGRRSVEQVHRDELKGAGGSAGQQRPGGAWHRAYVSFRWAERASQWDAAVAASEALELADARKEARARRAAVVSQFLDAAADLLASPNVFASAPAGVSAVVLRAISASREEFGSHVLPEAAAKGNGKVLSLDMAPPEVCLYVTDGERVLSFDEWPQQDQLSVGFDPLTSVTTPSAPAADSASDTTNSTIPYQLVNSHAF